MPDTNAFIAKWAASGAAKHANAQLFVAELCTLLGVQAPQPKTPDEQANACVFEKTIPGATAVQGKLIADEPDEPAAAAPVSAAKRPWPDSLPAQAAALRDLLAARDAPADTAALAAAFEGKRTPKRMEQMERLLETLAALGQAVEVKPGLWGR